MSIITIAVKNIRRYAGRYILFSALLFLVLTIGTISLIAGQTISLKLDQFLQQYGATLILTFHDHTNADYSAISHLQEVERVPIVRYGIDIYTDAINVDDKMITKTNWDTTEQKKKLQEINGLALLNETVATMAVCGVDFSLDNTLSLTEGRLPQDQDEILMDNRFADVFGFPDAGIGSTVTITIGLIPQTFEIVGICHPLTTTTQDTLSHRYVPFIAPIEAVTAFTDNNNLDFYLETVKIRAGQAYRIEHNQHYVILHDYTLYESFKNNLSQWAIVNRIFYSLDFVEENAKALVAAYESTAQICTFFLTAVIAISAVVILIMTALAMHERRYEIGVLLSVGMSKPRIAVLFALENLIFTLGVTVLAYAVGLAAAPFAADLLLEGVVEVSRATAALPVAARMLALAVGLSLPASFISSLAILAYKPMTILRSRS